jgi:hypothetical protein
MEGIQPILNPICIGVDIGKITDPTALSVSEVLQSQTGRYRACKRVPAHIDPKSGAFIEAKDAEPVMQTRYLIWQIGRMPLGTSYPNVATKFVDLLLHDRFETRSIRVLVDVTGVGQAVFDIIKKEIWERIHGIVYEEILVEGKGENSRPAIDAAATQAHAVKLLNPEQKERLKRVSLQPISFVHGEKYNRTKGTLGKAFLVSKMQALLQNKRVDLPQTPEAKATCDELLVYQVKISEKGTDTYGASTGKHDDLATALGLSCLEDPYALRITHSERVY